MVNSKDGRLSRRVFTIHDLRFTIYYVKQYHDLLKHILANGTTHEDRTGVGTISTFGYQTRFNLRDGFPIVTTKRVPFRWVAEELFWFLSGSTEERELNARGVDIWAEWATEEQTARFGRETGDLGPVYGYLWRSFGGDYPTMNGVDQIARLVNEIETNPNSRRLIVTGWNPETCDDVALPPCHTLFQFKVEHVTVAAADERIAESNQRPKTQNQKPILHCQLYQRSADAFLGVPFNISSYALLTHMIAHVCDLEVGDFIHTFGDLHIYSNHLEQVNELLVREPLPLPTLELVNASELKGLDGLLNFKYENLNLAGYQSYGKIAAPVAV
jgi:thymidylate synthase